MGDPIVPPRAGLPRPVELAALREAVGGESSWRGVMRRLGFTSSRTGRVLRQICDEHSIDYAHFRLIGPDDAALIRVVPAARSWPEALEQLGYAPDSGSARATVRKTAGGSGSTPLISFWAARGCGSRRTCSSRNWRICVLPVPTSWPQH